MKPISFIIGAVIGGFLGGLAGYGPIMCGIFGLAFGLIAGSIAHNLSGNKKVAMADPKLQAAAATMSPPEGKCGIYIVRKGFVGGKQGMDLTIEGAGSTQIKSGLYAYAEVEPGHHNIIAKPAKNAKEETKIQITTHGNDTVVVQAGLSMGAVNNSADLKIVTDATEAKALVAGAKMVALEN